MEYCGLQWNVALLDGDQSLHALPGSHRRHTSRTDDELLELQQNPHSEGLPPAREDSNDDGDWLLPGYSAASFVSGSARERPCGCRYSASLAAPRKEPKNGPGCDEGALVVTNIRTVFDRGHLFVFLVNPMGGSERAQTADRPGIHFM